MDVSLLEVVDVGRLKELYSASFDDCNRVFVAFEKFLQKVFGMSVYDKFKRENIEDWIDLHRDYEVKKFRITYEMTGKKTWFRVPIALFEIYRTMTKRNLVDDVKENKEFAGKVSFSMDKLRVDVDIVRSWFSESCDNAIKHVRDLFAQKESAGTSTILLAGGASQSQLLREYFRREFSDKRLITPNDATQAVLKGAVIFGHT